MDCMRQTTWCLELIMASEGIVWMHDDMLELAER